MQTGSSLVAIGSVAGEIGMVGHSPMEKHVNGKTWGLALDIIGLPGESPHCVS